MESQDYETNRNLTLMFFLEKLLVEKSGQNNGNTRSLHDLSCQFGTKGFSREMRQIAGGSQAGLKKFLLQYPSLFTIDGEQVSITQARPAQPGSPTPYGSRDYTREAIDYFKSRMKAYGPGTEVPIKSLLGHRSQAPPEVRHISGQHVKEFREFLAKFPEEFVVREEDDVIYLKEDEGKIRHQCNPEILEPTKIDPRITSKILSFVRELLLENDPEKDIESVFNQTVDHFQGSSEVENLPFRRSQDFDTFLKMHSHLFRVQSGVVSLVPLKSQFNIPSSNENVMQNNERNISGNGSKTTTLNQSLKQRVNSVVLKALADNSDRDRRSKTAELDSGYSSGSNGLKKPESPEALSKDAILRMTRVIMTAKEASQIVDQIMASKSPVAVDGEGINLGTKGQLTLLQVSTMEKHAYIFDLLADPKMWSEGNPSHFPNSS